MPVFLLRLLFTDKHIEEIPVVFFSDLSTPLDKSKFYYYETVNHLRGKGVCIKRSDLLCFEVVLPGDNRHR